MEGNLQSEVSPLINRAPCPPITNVVIMDEAIEDQGMLDESL